MKRFLLIIAVLLLAGSGYTQDPGIPDTLRLGNWGVYLPCPPCSGIATVPIFIFCDEYLRTIKFHLEAQGPITFSGVEWTSEIEKSFPDKQITLAGNKISIFLHNPFPIFPIQPPLGPGSRYIGSLVLLLEDTGAAVIDTFRPAAPPDSPLTFISTSSEVITPGFFSSPFDLAPQSIKPGDANGDNKTLLADVIYLLNYLCRSGPPPVNKQMSDVNLDCAVNLSDLIFLVNYIFKSGPKLLPSWCNDSASIPCPDIVDGNLVSRFVDGEASWSPDGKSIVYRHVQVSDSDSYGLYILNTFTKELKYLDVGLLAENPDWSPIGDWILFEKYGQIFKVKANGDSLIQLTISGENFFPEWSPDGSRIVYHRIIPVDSQGIWIMDLDGSNSKYLGLGLFPSWHPNGSKLLYVGLYEHLYTADTNGSNVVQVATLSGGFSTRHPSFSPQGDKIIFQYQLPGERSDTWIINSDGTNLKRLTTDGGRAPTWTPDGSKILYTNTCQYNGYLWIMNSNGSFKRQFTSETFYK